MGGTKQKNAEEGQKTFTFFKNIFSNVSEKTIVK